VTRRRPVLVALAGPSGAGKSTAGPAFLKDTLGIAEFVNADVIARGLSAFDPEAAAIAAVRVMLSRLRELAHRRADFAFETTLAGRSYAAWIRRLAGYDFHLVFLWLRDAALAVARVRKRVDLGGHDVPEEIVRRRYHAGLSNFVSSYRPLAKRWHFYDNSFAGKPRLVAEGAGRKERQIHLPDVWEMAMREAKR
jgi:predicted ABC-type ATPase